LGRSRALGGQAILPNFAWVEPGRVGGMGDPFADGSREIQEAIAELKRLGIGGVVNLTGEGGPGAALRAAGIEYLHLRTPDMQAPSLAAMERFVAFVAGCLQQRKSVAVYCSAGLGRTGTMLAVHLVSRGHAAEEAIAMVRQLRPGSVETAAQEDAVRVYAAVRAARERQATAPSPRS